MADFKETNAWLDEDSCKILFKKLVRCWGFSSYQVKIWGSDGYGIVLVDPDLMFGKCALMVDLDDEGCGIKALVLHCSFGVLYKTLLGMLVDFKKKCWKMSLFYLSTFFNYMPSTPSTTYVPCTPSTTRKYVTDAGEFVGCEAAIAIDMMIGAMQEK